ncbi:hypothetical protein BGZ46_002019 [Entomortierella lignicola]|nr:hypothetical protein BGZ46_002019 [Entomortierella lignicola]
MDSNNLDSVDRDGNTTIASELTSSPPSLDENISCNHEPLDNQHEVPNKPTAFTDSEVNTSLSVPIIIPNTTTITDSKAQTLSDVISDTTINAIPVSNSSSEQEQEQVSKVAKQSPPSSPSSSVCFMEAASAIPLPSSPSFSPLPAIEEVPSVSEAINQQDKREFFVSDSSTPIKPFQPLSMVENSDQSLEDASKGKEENNIPSKASPPLSIDTTGPIAQGSPLRKSRSMPRANVEETKTLPSSLNVHNLADPNKFLSSGSSSASSSSSLSDYLIIGQEQVERDDSECDLHSDISGNFYGEHDGSFSSGEYSDASLDNQGEDAHSHSQPRRRRNKRSSYVEGSENEQYDYYEDYEVESEHGPHSFVRRRITESAANEEFLGKDNSAQSQDKSFSSGSFLSLPTLQVPSIRGISRSIIEFVVVSAVCVTLMTCLFAFSYFSTGANHLLGWYSDQQIGQRIRDGLKEREHMVQEALEKMAGEEYVKVKRRSRQYQQQYQQQYQSSAYGGNPYQHKYQQQYQQEREQRQQQQQQQQHQGLSTAEWQDLIRAASMSFLSKWSKPTPVRGSPATPRR